MEDFYENRSDFLCNRKVLFENKNSKGETFADNKHERAFSLKNENAEIKIITERFERNMQKAAQDDIYEIVYDLKNSTISLSYHRDPNFIFSTSRKFTKPLKLKEFDDGFDKIKWSSMQHQTFDADPFFSEMNDNELKQLLFSLMVREKKIIEEIKSNLNEVSLILTEKKNDDTFNELKVDGFEIDDKRIERHILDTDAQKKLENIMKERETTSLDSCDYLRPYFEDLCITSEYFDESTEEQIKNRCLNDTKNNLVIQANALQFKYDTNKKYLYQKVNFYKENKFKLKDEQEKLILKEIEDYSFNIKILNKRLVNLKNEASMKLSELEKKILADQRLKAKTNKNSF